MLISPEILDKYGKSDDCTTEDDPEREMCDYENVSTRFSNVSKDFSKQYAHIYAARLGAMRQTLLKKVKLKWGDKYPVRKLFELKEEKEETCIIIGTLFKHQELKPSILKELSEELQIVPEPQRKNFVDDSDKLILEDELQRIRLDGDVIDVHKMVTGVVCAVLGYEEGDGIFKIKDVCFADCPLKKEIPEYDEDRFIVLASGLNMSSSRDNCFSLQLFGEWLTGLVGGAAQRHGVSKIVRLIIAGNSVSGQPLDDVNQSTIINSVSSATSGPGFDSLQAVQKLDSFLSELCGSISVDLMPGEFDPTNIMLPQNPMHYCMFPKAVEFKTFAGVPNPYECKIGGRVICGSSGQPIADILRYSKLEAPIDALRSTLQWGHIAPTAPDTLSCTPSDAEDPFIIGNCPDVFFAGNTDSFSTEIFEGSQGQKVRLVCVPSFAATQTVVLVNLKDLECYPMSFIIPDD